MTIPLTPDTLRAAYDYLHTTPPFNCWNLPDGEDVTFKVTRSRDTMGWHIWKDGRHEIQASSRLIGQTGTLMALMAHEMVHVYQAHSGMETTGNRHSKLFWRLAKQVCKHHDFDPHTF